MKASLASVPEVPVPSGLIINLAYQLFYTMGAASVAEEAHPVVRLEKILAVAEMKLTPDKIEAVVDNVPITLVASRCYFVEKKSGPEPLMASAADAMAYVYTAANEATTPICESNFRVGNPQAAIPVIKQSTPMNSDWKKTKGYDNSVATYKKLSMNKLTLFTAHNFLVSILKEAAATKIVEMVAEVPPAYAGPTIMQGTKRMSYISKPFVPGVQHIKDLKEVYRYMAAHRMARGEDNRWISPLTSGYYYGSMTRSMDRLVWETADVLHVLRLLDFNAVYYSILPSMSVCQSLAANGMVVFTRTTSPIATPFVISQDGRVIVPGVYKLRHMTNMPIKYLRVLEPLSTTRPVYKTLGTDFPQEEEYMDYLTQEADRSTMPVMATCFLTPLLLQSKKVTLIPSLHAHAGHVLALFNTNLMSIDRGLLISRIGTANVFKTWFPLSRTRFYEYDRLAYGFVNLALNNMFLSVHTKKLKDKASDFGPFEGEIAKALEQELGPQTTVCNSLWTPLIEARQLQSQMTYQQYAPPPPLLVPENIDPEHLARVPTLPSAPPPEVVHNETFSVDVENF